MAAQPPSGSLSDRVARAVELYGLIHHHASQMPSWDCELHRLLRAMSPAENDRYYAGIDRMYRRATAALKASLHAPDDPTEPELPLHPDPTLTRPTREDEEDPYAALR